ncbi:tyrosine-type recombinase/integrase [Chamaesiphon polymorphus]|uniref:Transposase n=1 Tax=Chamaesiphon polymorphus CCALA 037 TaxID=2107692 RepID=A0A2T1GDF7_9CYAN|nr:tyrosine-type recombinase/integrase [Chamaesiphon polymorphus]PSB55509.1 transposase [Chamaesiphon polymorphus CCALA 037]
MSILAHNNLSLDSWAIKESELASSLLANPLLKKDVWHTINDLGLQTNQHERVLTISFESIQQDWLKTISKLYVIVRSNRKLSAAYIKDEVQYLSRFSKFIEQKSIFRVEQINTQLFDEYDYYLKFLKLSPKTITHQYTTLNNFFNCCRDEGWLEVNTYWFKGRRNRSAPKNDDIEYIPEEIWQQLNEHLHYLPEPIQRMVIVIRATGLRIGELLNLPLDCLRKRDDQWRIRFLTEKYKVDDELPICEELVVIIKEQQEYIRQTFKDKYNNLFSANASRYYYIPVPKVMHLRGLSQRLNKLAQEHNICTSEGQIWYFKSHQFRRTFATIMTNAGVRDLIIQKYLRHRSPDMQNYYKHLYKEVLGDEYQELMKETSYINSTGKLVSTHRPKDLITEAIRRRMHQITTQYGECHRPILEAPCQTVNACWQCEHWLTSIDDLPVLEQDLQRVEIELNTISALGMVRQQQTLTVDKQMLLIRIEGLQKLNAKD